MSEISLHTIKKPGHLKTKKRVGRGNGSTGTYSGRGIKGQRARSGGKSGLKRLALTRRIMQLPKIHGMTAKRNNQHLCNIKEIDAIYKNGETVSPKTLFAKKLIPDKKHPVKVLGTGDFSKKLTFEKCRFSHAVRKKIEASGSTIV